MENNVDYKLAIYSYLHLYHQSEISIEQAIDKVIKQYEERQITCWAYYKEGDEDNCILSYHKDLTSNANLLLDFLVKESIPPKIQEDILKLDCPNYLTGIQIALSSNEVEQDHALKKMLPIKVLHIIDRTIKAMQRNLHKILSNEYSSCELTI